MHLEPLNYATPVEPPSARHNRIYMILLIVLASFYGIGMIGIIFVSLAPPLPAGGRQMLQMIACIYAVLIAGIVATLILRGTSATPGRIATTALNIVLLIFLPFGTAVGIYGLMKVDKDEPAGES